MSQAKSWECFTFKFMDTLWYKNASWTGIFLQYYPHYYTYIYSTNILFWSIFDITIIVIMTHGSRYIWITAMKGQASLWNPCVGQVWQYFPIFRKKSTIHMMLYRMVGVISRNVPRSNCNYNHYNFHITHQRVIKVSWYGTNNEIQNINACKLWYCTNVFQ